VDCWDTGRDDGGGTSEELEAFGAAALALALGLEAFFLSAALRNGSVRSGKHLANISLTQHTG